MSGRSGESARDRKRIGVSRVPSPSPRPLPWGEGNRPPRFRQSRASRLVAAREQCSLSLRERARVRGNETQPSKTAGRILQAQLDRLHECAWISHRAQSPSMVEGRAIASALVVRAFLPPHPALSLGERENRPPLSGESNALGSSQAHGCFVRCFPQPSPRRGRTVRCAFANPERLDSSQRGSSVPSPSGRGPG